MNISRVTTESEYHDALREIETLMSAERGTEEGARLDNLVTQVQNYERIHYPMDRSVTN